MEPVVRMGFKYNMEGIKQKLAEQETRERNHLLVVPFQCAPIYCWAASCQNCLRTPVAHIWKFLGLREDAVLTLPVEIEGSFDVMYSSGRRVENRVVKPSQTKH